MRASAEPASGQVDGASAESVPTVRFWLAADGQRVLIQVWDGCDTRPQRQQPEVAAESGRGLLLVEAMSDQWDWYEPDGWDGKIVWAKASTAKANGARPAGARSGQREYGG